MVSKKSNTKLVDTINELSRSLNCPNCRKNNSNLHSISCGHLFCYICLQNFKFDRSSESKCPLCFKLINKSEIHSDDLLNSLAEKTLKLKQLFQENVLTKKDEIKNNDNKDLDDIVFESKKRQRNDLHVNNKKVPSNNDEKLDYKNTKKSKTDNKNENNKLQLENVNITSKPKLIDKEQQTETKSIVSIETQCDLTKKIQHSVSTQTDIIDSSENDKNIKHECCISDNLKRIIELNICDSLNILLTGLLKTDTKNIPSIDSKKSEYLIENATETVQLESKSNKIEETNNLISETNKDNNSNKNNTKFKELSNNKRKGRVRKLIVEDSISNDIPSKNSSELIESKKETKSKRLKSSKMSEEISKKEPESSFDVIKSSKETNKAEETEKVLQIESIKSVKSNEDTSKKVEKEIATKTVKAKGRGRKPKIVECKEIETKCKIEVNVEEQTHKSNILDKGDNDIFAKPKPLKSKTDQLKKRPIIESANEDSDCVLTSKKTKRIYKKKEVEEKKSVNLDDNTSNSDFEIKRSRTKKAQIIIDKEDSFKSDSSSSSISRISRSRSSSNEREKILVMCSGLDALQKRKLEKASNVLDFEIVNNWSTRITHLVVNLAKDTLKKDMLTTRSIKYLMGLLGNKWIVSFDWVTASINSNKLVDERQYEVRGVRNCVKFDCPKQSRKEKLSFFKDYAIHFKGKFEKFPSDIKDVKCLVQIGGGLLIEDEEEISTMNTTDCGLKFIVVTELIGLPETQNSVKYVSISTFLDSMTNLEKL